MPHPDQKTLILIGGGHTHALMLQKWNDEPNNNIRCILINPATTAPYTGMLPGHIAGHYSREELDIDLEKLSKFAGIDIIYSKAFNIDRAAQIVHLENDVSLDYDILSVDIGVTSELSSIEGFSENAQSVKPLGPFAQAWNHYVDAMDSPADAVVIGGGIGGVEIALAMAHRLTQAKAINPTITLIEAGPEILSVVNDKTRKVLLKACDRYNINIITDRQITYISETDVHLSDGRSLAANFIVSAAGARAYPWIAKCGFAHTNGFINVGPDLRAIGENNIFAVGDCAHLTHAPRPKAGVYAVRQAPILLNNIRALLTGSALEEYHPQSDYLKLISMGSKSAVGHKYWMTFAGGFVWRLKNRIDKDFMESFYKL